MSVCNGSRQEAAVRQLAPLATGAARKSDLFFRVLFTGRWDNGVDKVAPPQRLASMAARRLHLLRCLRLAAILTGAAVCSPVRAQEPPLQVPQPPALQAPVAAACISSPFGWRRRIGPLAPEGFHNGVDLPAPAGAKVRAALPGTVQHIRRFGVGGVTVHMSHPGGLVTLYAHMGTIAPLIGEGKRPVAAGETLGAVARTGVTYGTHLFFAVLRDGQAVDPEPLLGVPRCRR